MTAVFQRVKTWAKTERPELVQIARLVRYETEAALAVTRTRLSPSARAKLSEYQNRRDLRLHIASGTRYLSGWVNLDTGPAADIRLDLRRPLPFATGSASMAFSEHFLDHLEYPNTAERVLSEIRRVLKPGGRLRIVVHDAELLARAYVQRDAGFFQRAIAGNPPFVQWVNLIFRFNGFHQFIYDFETLEALLLKVGFSRVLRCSFRGSEIPELNVDFDNPDRPVQSLYVEAIAGAQG